MGVISDSTKAAAFVDPLCAVVFRRRSAKDVRTHSASKPGSRRELKPSGDGVAIWTNIKLERMWRDDTRRATSRASDYGTV